jgi:iron complex transport system permease protein
MLVSLNIGYANISFGGIVRLLIQRIPILGSLIGETGLSDVDSTIVMKLRLPRIVGGMLVGAALAASGVTYQGIFRNPMAGPYIIGTSSGAALGAAIAIVLGVGYGLFGIATIPISAFLGALGAMFLVYNVSRVGSKVPVTTLLLSGIAVSIFLSSIVTFLEMLADENLHVIVFWLMGGLSRLQWGEVVSVLPLVIVGSVVLLLYARDLNIMTMGEDTAQHLGVETEKVKKILLVVTSLLTAAAVSISGLIGFVGLIIPHITRILIGPDHRILMPTSMVVGAIFLVLCDSLARALLSPTEIPVGIITAMSGGPFFIYLLRKKRESYTF